MSEIIQLLKITGITLLLLTVLLIIISFLWFIVFRLFLVKFKFVRELFGIQEEDSTKTKRN